MHHDVVVRDAEDRNVLGNRERSMEPEDATEWVFENTVNDDAVEGF